MGKKIQIDTEELVKNNIINSEIAKQIENFYSKTEQKSSNNIYVIFGILGALLVGLGINLVVAYNWDELGKTVQTIFAFLPLMISQILVFYTFTKKSLNRTWIEASSTLLFFSVGISLTLVTQIYNLDISLSNYFAVWIALCIPLVYLLKTHFVSLLLIVFSAWYANETGFYSYERTAPYLYLIYLAALAPFYVNLIYKKPNSHFTKAHHWIFAVSFTSAVGTFGNDNPFFFFGVYAILFSLYAVLSNTKYFLKNKLITNSYKVIAVVGFVVLIGILSYLKIWEVIRDESDFTFRLSELVILIPLLITSLVLLFLKNKNNYKEQFSPFEYAFIPIILLLITPSSEYFNYVIINFLMLLFGVYYIVKGVQTDKLLNLNLGLIITSLLITMRFFDTEFSFIVKGLVFIVIGLGFFFANSVILKKRKAQEKTIE